MNLDFLRLQLRLLLGSTALVVALAALGLCGVFAVRLLPDAPVLRHCEQSVRTFVKEGEWPLSLCSRLDNYMDSMTLNIASYDGPEGILERSLMNYLWVTDRHDGAWAFATRFPKAFDSHGEKLHRAKYVRYWFGSVVLVRPLFLVMNYRHWRVFNTVLVFVTLAALLYLMYASGLRRFLLPILVPLVLIDPVAVGKSIQFSPCFYLSIVPSLLVLLLRKTRLVGSPGCLALTFAGIGALTSYFDLLTYPILTAALPLAFYLLLNRERPVVGNVRTVVACLVHWALGFLLMWILKWVLTTALTDMNVFSEVFQKIVERSGSSAKDGLHISRLHAVRVNLMDFLPYLNAWLVGGFVLALVSLYRGRLTSVVKWLPAFLLAALPPTWMFLTANHAYIHHFFVSKGLTVSVFVFLCWVADALLSKGAGRKA